MISIIWEVNPILFELYFLKLYWYGIFFAGSFIIGFYLLKYLFKKENIKNIPIESLFLYIFTGTIIGARLFHCIVYEPSFYIYNPLEIIKIWNGGLASHGAIIGSLSMLFIFANKKQISFSFLLSRLLIPGFFIASMIRVGNFFNSEIIGIPYSGFTAIIFKNYDMISRHPVQLYESFAYFLFFLFLIIYHYKYTFHNPLKIISISTIYLFVIRFILEYFKLNQANYNLDLPLSVGQLSSIPFIFIGLYLFFKSYNKKE